MTLDLSVAMLVREPPIERLVALIDYMSVIASEFVIVDTGSSTETLQAMAMMNKAPWGLPKVLILQREWRDDFAWARNEGLDKVTRKWTLILDPDELPSFKMMEHIRHVVTNPNESLDMIEVHARAPLRAMWMVPRFVVLLGSDCHCKCHTDGSYKHAPMYEQQLPLEHCCDHANCLWKHLWRWCRPDDESYPPDLELRE